MVLVHVESHQCKIPRSNKKEGKRSSEKVRDLRGATVNDFLIVLEAAWLSLRSS